MPLFKKKQVTLNDVAREAKIAPPLVAAILTNSHPPRRIREEERERVLQLARDLGYRHTAANESSFTLGFLMLGYRSLYGFLNFMGALNEAEKHGYIVKCFLLHETAEDKNALHYYLKEPLDGLIVTYEGMQNPNDIIEHKFQLPPIPTVRITARKMSEQGVEIHANDEQGTVDAVKYLAELGHRSIAFLGGIEGNGTGVPRLAGFQRGVREAGVPISYVRWTHWDETGIHACVGELVARPAAPTAFLCGGDNVAMRVIQKLGELGLRVPQDFSVVGIGNLQHAHSTTPALTTVAVPYDEMGQEAVTRLLSIIQSPDHQIPNEEVLMPTPLIIRKSAAPPPPKDIEDSEE